MFATSISAGATRSVKDGQTRTSRIGANLSSRWAAIATFALLFPTASFAADTSASVPQTNLPARFREAYAESRVRYQHDTNDLETAWQFTRACFDLAQAATNNTDRARIADEGIAIGRRLIGRKPDLVQMHYYLGMNLGQLADTKRNLAALRIVDEMEREFEAARKLDEHFDHAGPDRNLGLLYFEAPSFISIGSRSKARQHLQRAVELAPDFPENRLNYLEALLKWGDRSEALRELKAVAERWRAARQGMDALEWSANRPDWEKRFSAAKKKLGDDAKSIELMAGTVP